MPPEKPLKHAISITLDYPVIEKIKELAIEADRPVSQYINMVLKAYIANISKE